MAGPLPPKKWEGWGWTIDKLDGIVRESPGPVATLEEAEMKPNVGAKLARVVHWRHHTGKWVVVSGPFPDRFYRSETREEVGKAAKILVDDIFNRPATTREDQYCKVLASDILEIKSGENEFGPISP